MKSTNEITISQQSIKIHDRYSLVPSKKNLWTKRKKDHLNVENIQLLEPSETAEENYTSCSEVHKIKIKVRIVINQCTDKHQRQIGNHRLLPSKTLDNIVHIFQTESSYLLLNVDEQIVVLFSEIKKHLLFGILPLAV